MVDEERRPDTGTDLKGYHRFWAKTGSFAEDGGPYHLLPYHNLDVAAVATSILERDSLLSSRLGALLGLDEEPLHSLIRTFVALHDVGKFSERFQSLSPEIAQQLGAPTTDRGYNLRHDTLGFGAWRDILFSSLWKEDSLRLRTHHGDQWTQWEWGDYFEALMKPIAGHHGMPPLPEEWHKASRQFSEESRTAMISYVEDVVELLLTDVPFADWDYSHVERVRRATWLLAGLTVVADWIGSDSNFFRFRTEPMPLGTYWREYALPQAKDAVTQAGLLPTEVSASTGLGALFPNYVPTPMQKYASEVPLGEEPELFILEDATGSGKTEAALVLAHRLMKAEKAEGIYVGLPTMATANAMYERLAAAYQRLFAHPERASLALAHSARELSGPFRQSIGLESVGDGPTETYSEEQRDRTAGAQCSAWIADQRKKSLLAHVGVGTIDQALLGVLPSGHQSLRLLGLGRNVLIVDEVHAYDQYMQRLLRGLLQFHAANGGSAILLSATLPHSMRRDLVDAFQEGADRSSVLLESSGFPLATHVPAEDADETEVPVNDEDSYRQGAQIRDGYHREVDLEFFHQGERALEKLMQVAENGRCACWVRNTVPDARTGWKDLREQFEESSTLTPEQVDLFHARYALADRQAIEENVLARYGPDSGPEERAGRILVATQVVEQSLDLDFDYMVMDLAPMDLVVQRAGRMQRHLRDAAGRRIEDGPDQRPGPLLGVLMPRPIDAPEASWYSDLFPRAAYVYPHVGHLWRTARVLADKGEIRIPEQARSLIEQVYGAEAEAIPDALQHPTKAVLEERRVEESIAAGNVLQLGDGYGGMDNRGRWTREDRAPTRLGEPTTTLRLGRLQDEEIKPWCEVGEQPWQRSELRMQTTKVADEPRRSRDRQMLVDRAKETMPDGGEWSVLVVLENQEDMWVGRARNENGEPVALQYTARAGLTVNPLTE